MSSAGIEGIWSEHGIVGRGKPIFLNKATAQNAQPGTTRSLSQHGSPGERMALSLKKMTAEQWPTMISGTSEQIDRRFELLNRENDLRNKNILDILARSVQPRPEKQP